MGVAEVPLCNSKCHRDTLIWGNRREHAVILTFPVASQYSLCYDAGVGNPKHRTGWQQREGDNGEGKDQSQSRPSHLARPLTERGLKAKGRPFTGLLLTERPPHHTTLHMGVAKVPFHPYLGVIVTSPKPEMVITSPSVKLVVTLGTPP